MGRLRNPEPIILELERWSEFLTEAADEYGFDLSDEMDIQRIENISYAESICRSDEQKANSIIDWVDASPAERSFANAYHRVIVVMDLIADETPDENECPCCNSDAVAIAELVRISFLCGYLRLVQIDNIVSWEISDFLSKLGKDSVSHRNDQRLKPAWIEHCSKAKLGKRPVSTLDDLLNIDGYDPALAKISARTLKAWANEAGISFKAGRPKK